MGKNIKNIIFDLGGVIINIDFNLTFQAFAKLLSLETETIRGLFLQHQVFSIYEKGGLSDAEFRNMIRSISKQTLKDEEIDIAWNSMLLDIPKQRVEMLDQLAKHQRLFLLSNTNALHIKSINAYVQENFQKAGIHAFFEKAYLSYEIKMAKPDLEIYNHVLQENQLDPSETLFVDDSADNIKGAEKAGIKGYFVQQVNDLWSKELMYYAGKN